MNDPVDLLIIGGGINGCGVARDAAGRGLSVLLCEKDDLSEGTSSRSGKYIHGGLRYLEYYEFSLVREALIEREVVLAAAPHIAWPLRLVLPHSPEQRPRWLIRLGLLLYDNLGGRQRVPGTESLDLRHAPEGVPVRDDFSKAFAYYDVWCDDARLTVLNAIDARRKGAEILTRTACISARRDGTLWRARLRDIRSGDEREIYARAIFNTAGPWLEQVLSNVVGINSAYNIRLVKGSHLIMRKWWQGDHGYVLQARDRRIIFVNPWFEDLALIGTTDIPYEGKPEAVSVDEDEIDYLLNILNRYFLKTLSRDDIVDAYAGVRPLYDDDSSKNASAVTRDYTFELNGGEGQAPIISAFGGKITTFRKLAEHGLQRLRPYLPEMGVDWTKNTPLPGGNFPDGDFSQWYQQFCRRYPWMPNKLALHFAQNYGSEADNVLDGANELSDLGRHFGSECYEREISWLLENEFAQSAEDILTRRTRHHLFLTAKQQEDVKSYCEGQDRQSGDLAFSSSAPSSFGDLL